MGKLLQALIRDERGQDLIEYAVLAGFIAITITFTWPVVFGNYVWNFYQKVLVVLGTGK